MAVYDRRAHTGLETLRLALSAASGRYARYMELVEFCGRRRSGTGTPGLREMSASRSGWAARSKSPDGAYAACDAQVEDFASTRRLLLDSQDRLGWTDAAPTDGAFYFWAQPGEAMLARYGTSTAYGEALLERTHVALTPGTDFDTVNGDSYIRLSFAAGYDAVAAAIERIVEFQRGQ